MNRHDSGLWHGYLSIVLSPRWHFLRSRSSEVTRSNCRFRSFGVVAHVYGSVFSSRTRKMTLKHRSLHRNRNKMKIWKCMVLRPNALKSSHFHIQSAIKTTFLKGITWNLVHTFFSVSSSTCIPVFENFEIWGIFEKNVKKSQNFQNFPNFKTPR